MARPEFVLPGVSRAYHHIFKMSAITAEDDMFKYFADDTSQGHWTVVFFQVLTSLLVYRCYVGGPPVPSNLPG